VRKRLEEWQQDINARQRSIVFPDTAQNEARLWRNLASGKQKLTTVQVIGIALIVLTIVSIEWREVVRTFRFGTSGPTFDRLLTVFLNLAIPLGLFGFFLLVLRWRVRRALPFWKRPKSSALSSQVPIAVTVRTSSQAPASRSPAQIEGSAGSCTR
jgi:hypothetical protein